MASMVPAAGPARPAAARQRTAVADPQRAHRARPDRRRAARGHRRLRLGARRRRRRPGSSRPCCSPRSSIPPQGAHGADQHHRRAPRGLDVLPVDHVAVGRRARLRLPQHDPQRRALHPRPGSRRGHDRPPGLGLRPLRGGGSACSSWPCVLLRVRLERPLLLGHARRSAWSSLPMLVLGVDPMLVALVVAAFVGGAGIEVFGMGWNLAMQENIDDACCSRAYSYDALGSFVAMPIGQLAWGPLGCGVRQSSGARASRHRVRRHLRRSCSAPARCATCRGHRRPPWPR